MPNIIFVAGVHGVGKSTLCKRMEDLYPFKHLTASDIIKKYKKPITDTSKFIADIDDNQRILVSGLKHELIDGKSIMLDGHFALLDESGNPSSVDSNVFERLTLDGIIIIIHEPKVIVQRLLERDGFQYDVELFSTLQEMEVHRGREVADALNIPLVVIDLRDQHDPESIFSSFLLTYI